MNVYWTPRAKKHLDSHSGRAVEHLQDANIRELIEGKYRIVYHIIRERIDIIAVVHTSRNTLLG